MELRQETKRRLAVAAILLAAVLLVFLTVHYIEKSSPVSVTSADGIHTVILDPGHGGFDGGATGIGGVVEKDINLQIALKLRDILKVNGFEVIMTRETDDGTHDQGSTISQKKKSDMRNRLKLINGTPNAVTISIHQNLFEQSQYSGAQMFYGKKNSESKLLAQSIQESFVTNLQKDNKREIKEAGKDLYLMYYAETPIVLAECGFISNPIESALLSDDTYQNKVAFTIFSGLMNYLSAG